MISFVIPAYNEEALIGLCLNAIRKVMAEIGCEYEVVVVDDASTDATATIAVAHGAQLISVSNRQIAATRNAGARQAKGDVIFFVDADTQINAGIVRSALGALQRGAIGGGALPLMEGSLPLWFRGMYPLMLLVARLINQTGGACLFCTREAFAATGGFDETLFAGEEDSWVKALKRQGRFVLVPERVLTSGRNLRTHSPWTIVRLLLRLALHGTKGFKNREGLDLWYQPNRGG